MPKPELEPETADAADAPRSDEVAYWENQLRLAAKIEEKWRKLAAKLVERYEDQAARAAPASTSSTPTRRP